MLFTFPSRYLSTIGHQVVFSLGRWSSQIPTGFLVSRGTRVPSRRPRASDTGLSPATARLSIRFSSHRSFVTPCRLCKDDKTVPRPPCCNGRSLTQHGFRLFPVRSPLLGESLLFSFPPGTEMFQFPGLAPTRLWIQRVVAGIHRRGFPHSDIFGSTLV